MNQIYACREGRKNTFTDAKISGTATTTPTRSARRTIFSKLLLGVFLFLVVGAVEVSAQGTRTYNTAGASNFIVPPGVTQITFDVTGAGGGGAGADNTATKQGGGGGGGGSFERYINVPVTPGQTIVITIGAGGTGGAANTAGAPGGITSVSVGGISHAGGAGGAIITGGNGGAGHTQAGGTGGDGAPGLVGGLAIGGGGGGAATLALNGTNGNNGPGGGAGGTVGGGSATVLNGGNATANGGGGAGGTYDDVTPATGIGGNGGAGMVVLTYTCPTYTLPAFGPFCQTDAAFSVTGPGTLPAGTAALAGLSPNFYQNLGPTLSGTGVTGTLATGFSFNPATAGPGCFTLTYSYADPNPLAGPACVTSVTRDVVVFPTSAVLAVPANTCGVGISVPNSPVAGFTQQFSFDNEATWVNASGGASTTGPATPGCYTISTRYIKNGACGNVANGALSPCPNSAKVQAVVFPPSVVLNVPTNTCATGLVVTPTTAVAGFTQQFSFDNGATWQTSNTGPTTPGCYTITSRYVLTSACGGTAAGAAGPCANSTSVQGVVFPQSVVLNVPANTCATGLVVTPTTAVAGFTQQFSFDNGTTWQTSNTGPTTPGCYTITSRYVLTAACGGTAAGAAGPCANSTSVQAVVFPQSVVLNPIANSCATGLVATPSTAVAGFTQQFSFDNGTTWQTSNTGPTTPGCYTITSRYVLTAACGGTAAGAAGPCPNSTAVQALVYPTSGVVTVAATCAGTSIAPDMPNVTGFTEQFSVDGGATWWSGLSPVNNAGCYTVIGRYVNTAACGLTPALTPGPCANSAAVNVLIYPLMPVINAPATTCAPTQFALPIPAVPDQTPNFNTQWSVVPTGNAPNWQFFPALPTAPGVYDVQARYVNAAACGAIAAGTAGPGCSVSNIVQATINKVPVVTVIPNQTPVCCQTNINVPGFSLSNNPMVPAGGTVVFNWTNSNPSIGLAAAGVGNIPAFVATCQSTTQVATITVTATHTNAGQSCTSAPMIFTITVNANVTGTITGPDVAICAGQNADLNVNLGGVANFSGNLTITPISGIGLATPNLAFGPAAPVGGGAGPLPAVTVNGPSAITIPAIYLPNTSSNTTVYRISWNTATSLIDGNGCQPVAGQPLTGFQDVTVYPLPTIAANRVATVPTGLSTATQLCPGTAMVFNVTNPNVIPGSLFNWIARDNAGAGATLGSANNVAFGSPALTTSLSLACPTTHTNPIRFTFTPIGPGPLGCVGVPVSIDVWVGDNVAPVGPANPSTNLGNTCLAAVPAAPTQAAVRALFTDNCTANGSLNLSGPVTNTTGTNCNWTVTYTYQVGDACNNTATYVVTYTGADTQAPTWTTAVGSLNTTINCGNNAAAFNAQLAAAQAFVPSATDNCNANPNANRVKVAGAFAQANPGTCVSVGTYTNTFFTNDGCGNTSVAFTQVITITDNTPPTLGNPGTQTLDVGAGANCQVPLPDYRGLVSYTDCTPILAPGLIQTPAPGTTVVGSVGPGPVGGSVTVQVTAQDGCGNSSTIFFNVNLVDATAPIARCHNVTLNLDASGQVTMVPSVIDGNKTGVAGNTGVNGTVAPYILSSDNCGLATFNNGITFTPNNTGVAEPFPAAEGNSNILRVFKCNDVGVNNIVLLVTDLSGNTDQCTAQVTIRDVTPPVITCAPGQTFQKNATCVTILPSLVGVGQTTATDACGIASIQQIPAAGSIIAADVASLPVQFIATDVNGNTSTCTTTILFRDQTPPVISGCPAPITVFTGAGNTDCQVFVVWTPPTASDNCSPILGNTTLTSTHQPQVPSAIGTANGGLVNIPAGQPGTTSGNGGPYPSTISVSGIPAGSTVQSVTLNGITHTFPADIDIVLVSPLGTAVSLMSDVGGSNSLTGQTYTIRDGFPALTTGLNATGTYSPTNLTTGDNYPAPGPGTMNDGSPALATFGNGNHNGNWSLFVVDDLGGDSGFMNNWSITFFNPSATNGSPFFVGTTTVTYTATDAAGNTATCSFPVTVVDNTLPIITCNSPGDKTVNATASCVYTHNGTNWDATGTDNCIPVLSATYTLTGATTGTGSSLNGRSFNLGTTTVTWRVVDQSTNSTTCSFNVTVVDTQVPTLTCPANVAINSNTANCAAVVPVASLTPIFSDNCAVTLVEWSVSGATPISSGIGSMGNYTFSLGTSLVTFRVSDAAGNSTLCTFNVVVTNALAGAISGNATAAQNAATTSTITFTGSGAPASPTTTYTFTYNVNGGPAQTVTTGAGSNVVTVAQSNAVVGTYVYTLTAVSANNMPGCAGAVTPPNTATVNVVVGQPDLTNSQFFSTTQIAAGGTIDEVVSIRNVGTAATSGPIVFTVTNYAAITGLSAVSNTNPTVTIGFTTYTLDNANWTITTSPSALTFTSNAGIFINPGATRFLGVRINRAAGANGTVTHSSTITGGTGGGETPTNNNSISNTLLKN